jgi:formylglycine-generating enzyme required for sulfatase activity
MTMRLFASLCVVLAAAMLTFPAWSQQRANQVALLIGNANYPDAGAPLPTTLKDARALADELRRDDFDVDLKENVSKDAMQRAIDAFTGKIRGGTVALFYFSGFGIQVARQTYLIPVNAQIWSEDDTKRDGISLDAIVADMHRKGARVQIVIIDASRRSPFERRFRPSAAGIAALEAPQNTLAMYSAAPGAVINDGTGDNSLFVNELIKQMRVPNLTAEEVFNRTRMAVSRASNNEQTPWVASSLIEEFSFGAPAKVAATPAPATPPPTRPSAPAPTPPASQAPRPTPPAPQVPKPTVTETKPTPPPPAKTEAGNKPGDTFRDCPECSELVVVPAGSFSMGSGAPYEGPSHKVTIAKPFAVGRFEVTFDEWDHCVADKRCSFKPDDRGLGRGNRPVVNVSWLDAKEFIAWISGKTGKTYRLPSEAEWEYVTRGGTTSVFWWGRDVGQGQANCRDCNSGNALETMPVGSFKPNPFGVFDTAGNAAEWVEDCWNDSYRGAPQDGAAWTTGQCNWRVLRGGSYDTLAKFVASAARFRYDYDVRYPANGFRVLRELQ